MRKGKPCVLLMGVWIGTATMENSMVVPQKIKNRATIWSSTTTSGIYLKKTKTLIGKDMHPYVHCSIVYNSQNMDTI